MALDQKIKESRKPLDKAATISNGSPSRVVCHAVALVATLSSPANRSCLAHRGSRGSTRSLPSRDDGELDRSGSDGCAHTKWGDPVAIRHLESRVHEVADFE